MVAKSDKEKVKTLLSETIRLLCKNGLQFKAEFCVEALVGITLDQDEEFFLSIKETVKSDIVSSTRESSPPPHRKSKSDRKSREVHVKTDVSPSSCQRKRISDREPTESGDFQQDVGQSYWGNSSVHGEDSGGGNTPRKRRHIQTTQEDDSNPQIVIKGEPDSDSDIEEVASTSQDDHSLGAMPGTFGGYLPAPDQSYLDNVSSQPLPQQVWDQLPPFSSLPGTSAVPTTPSTMASGAGHSQVSVASQVPPGRSESTDIPGPPRQDSSMSVGLWVEDSMSSTASPVFTGHRAHGLKYQCPSCQTPCANKGSLQRHMKIHLESPEFTCGVCGQSYYEKWRLVRHMRAKNHTAPAPSQLGVGP